MRSSMIGLFLTFSLFIVPSASNAEQRNYSTARIWYYSVQEPCVYGRCNISVYATDIVNHSKRQIHRCLATHGELHDLALACQVLPLPNLLADWRNVDVSTAIAPYNPAISQIPYGEWHGFWFINFQTGEGQFCIFQPQSKCLLLPSSIRAP